MNTPFDEKGVNHDEFSKTGRQQLDSFAGSKTILLISRDSRFANEGLWPLCHVTHTRPIFRESDWQSYKAANQKCADSVLEELPAQSPVVFVHDYHFTLLPRMIRDKRPDATLVHFWHIPWPAPEVFAICPYQQEILDGLLACDLLGFHVQQHCNNFLDTVNRLTESRVDVEKFSVIRQKQETRVRPFPISVAEGQSGVSQGDNGEAKKIITQLNLENALVCVGVDRIDYRKGYNRTDHGRRPVS